MELKEGENKQGKRQDYNHYVWPNVSNLQCLALQVKCNSWMCRTDRKVTNDVLWNDADRTEKAIKHLFTEFVDKILRTDMTHAVLPWYELNCGLHLMSHKSICHL